MPDDEQPTSSQQTGINLEAVHCPQCGERMPAIRVPESMFQLLWGGWSCPACGCKMDKWGKAIES